MAAREYASGLRFACVCASNVNRSMAAHQILQKNNFQVSSYGTNSAISLPGPGKANTYDFGTTYSEILADLQGQGVSYYAEMGLLELIQRDQEIKDKPERFLSIFEQKKYFDIIFTYEKQPIMQRVLELFHANGNITFQLSHIVNIETQDDTTKARSSAATTLKLARELGNLPNLTEGLEQLLNSFPADQPITYHIVSY
jgi:RNA polymerase II subunit A C-terminal domain phosphatase SSU72